VNQTHMLVSAPFIPSSTSRIAFVSSLEDMVILCLILVGGCCEARKFIAGLQRLELQFLASWLQQGAPFWEGMIRFNV